MEAFRINVGYGIGMLREESSRLATMSSEPTLEYDVRANVNCRKPYAVNRYIRPNWDRADAVILYLMEEIAPPPPYHAVLYSCGH